MNRKRSPLDPAVQLHSMSARLVAGMIKVAELVRVLQWEKAKRHSLSPVQVSMLSFMAYHPHLSHRINSLAAEFSLTKATVSDSVRVLVEKGLLERIASETDARSHELKLTAAAEPIVAELSDLLKPLVTASEAFAPEALAKQWEGVAALLRAAVNAQLISPPRMCYFCQYYTENEAGYFCQLLQLQQDSSAVRLDCPEYVAAEA